jgi:drug/metabolite transporter (DMT)-like permease
VIALARSIVVLGLSGALVGTSSARIHIWRPWELWARSITGSVSMLFVFFSLTRLPISIVLTLMNLAPLWVAIASWFLHPETRSKGIWGAIVVGLTGVILIQQPQLAQGNLAVLAPLAASFLLAVVMLSLHRVQHIDTRVVVFHYSLFAFLSSLSVFAFSAFRSTLQLPTGWTPGLMLVGTGVAATLGQVFLTRAFAMGAPSKVAVVGLSQVGMAMLYDVGIWGHELGWLSLSGIVLVVAPTGWLLYTERQSTTLRE